MEKRRSVMGHIAASADGYIARPDGDIDEFVISVVPVFIGNGIPLIARRHRLTSLELLSTERFDDGLVQLRYAVTNVKASG